MVDEEIWEQAGLSQRGGMLCIGCLEHRLGRKLWGCDFTDLPINDPNLFHKSSRLRARLTDFTQLIPLIDRTGAVRAWAERKPGWSCDLTGNALAFVAFDSVVNFSGAQIG